MAVELMKLRLDKYLADMGIGTRTEVKKAITKGQVRVNEETVKRPEIKIDTEKDHVFYQGQMVAYAEYEYYMLNKPAGVVSATEDKNDSTVLDLIDEKQRKDLFPVGRLDKDTEGLLLITNDGELAHQLLSPKKHVDKVYFARIDGKVTEEDVRRFAEGLEIGEEKPTLPAHLEILKREEISEIRLTIREGKFHQVKRMFHAVGKEVIYLKRLQMGSLVLDPRLALGEYRELTGQELEALRALRGNQDDVLIVRNNLLTDTSIANVALEKEGVWYTPRTPLLKGTKRALLLEQGVLTECDIPSDEISSYSHIALFNAMIDFQSLVLEINRDTVIRV